ncbi:hypothetical protein EI555_014524, partial [Monodon monoceros]
MTIEHKDETISVHDTSLQSCREVRSLNQVSYCLYSGISILDFCGRKRPEAGEEEYKLANGINKEEEGEEGRQMRGNMEAKMVKPKGPQTQSAPSTDEESTVKDTKEDDHGSISPDKAEDRLQEEGTFDQEEQGKKVKAKHVEKRLLKSETKREASKRQAEAKDEGRDDPDKYRRLKNQTVKMENEISDTRKKQRMRKRTTDVL